MSSLVVLFGASSYDQSNMANSNEYVSWLSLEHNRNTTPVAP
jgi:hypothetical protein